MIDRRRLIQSASLAVPALAFPAILRGAMPDAPVATCAQGRLKGVGENGVLVFKGGP